MVQRLGIRRPRVAGRMPAGPLVKASAPTSLPGGLALPSGSQVTDATAMLGALQGRTAAAVNGAAPLPRDQGFWSLFGPGAPLYPSPLNQPNPRTGQADPRQTEYPVSYNILSNDRPVPWSMLRAAADKVDIIRLCLRTRKDELCQLEWGFGFTTDAEQQLGITSVKAKQDMREKYSDQFAKLKEFWSIPDKTNDLTWSEWLGMLLEERFVLDAATIYPRLTYGGDLASLEVIDGACYSADTEVLTEAGWKTFDQVDIVTDRFATRDQKTHGFQWQQATYFHEADWDSARDGRCYSVASRTLDLIVTPNHRILVTSLPRALGGSSHAERGEHFVRAEDLFIHGSQAQAIPATSTWDAPDITTFDLPASGRTNSLPFSCTGDQYAAFMGMWLAEGCAPNGDQVMVSQKPASKGFEPYRALLAEIFGRKVCHTGANFVIGRKCLHDYLAQFGHAADKFVPALLKGASRRQLEIFWRFYMLGDGYYEANGRQGINTVSRRMADDLQEIAQKIGYSASIGEYQSASDTTMADGRVIKAENKRRRYTIRLRTSPDQRYRMAKVDYVGKVYCVSVPNETLYVRRNGKPAWCGNTIKPLIDEYGNRPAPPAPAYQQWLYGFPRGEYTDDGASDTWEGTAGSLIYKPYTRRTQSPFGFPEVEQALISAEVYLRRQDWMRKEYTAGTLPRTMLKMDMSAGQMTPEQRRAWQVALNDDLSGDTAARQDFTLLPGGFDPVVSADMAERYKADYDEFLVKLLCAHMATQPSEIGFTPSNGLGGAGFSDAQEDVTYRKSLRPTLSWLIDIVNQISRQYLDMPAELTFQFLGMESEDEDAADQVAQRRISNGRMTLNEDRDRTGQPRYDFDEADKPMLMTGRGLVFIEGAAANAQPGVEIGPAQAAPTGAAAPTPPGGDAAPPVGGQDDEQGQQVTEAADAAKAELAAFGRFLAKRGKLTRPFAFTALDKADADVLNALAETDAEAAQELAKRFNPNQARDAHGKWLGGALARLVGATGSAPAFHVGESPDFHSLDDKFSVGGTRLTAARLGPPSISHEETKRQIASFMDDHPEQFTKGTHVAVQDHKGARRLARAGSAVALMAALSGLGGQSSGDDEHFTEIPDAGPAATEMYNQFHGVEDKDDTFYIAPTVVAAGHKADDAGAHEVVRRMAGRSLVKLNKDWADMSAQEREAFLESVTAGVESTGTSPTAEKADGGGARGRGGAPEGARRGDRGEYATYPLHAPGTGP